MRAILWLDLRMGLLYEPPRIWKEHSACIKCHLQRNGTVLPQEERMENLLGEIVEKFRLLAHCQHTPSIAVTG